MSKQQISNGLYLIGGLTIIIPLFCFFSVNYILFHTITKLVSVAFAFTIFSIAWNTRNLVKTHLYLVLALGFCMAAIFDIIHALAYKEFNLFVHAGLNMTIQTWVISRLIAVTATLIAIHIYRNNIKIEIAPATIGPFIIEFSLLYLLFQDHLPKFYATETGLTTTAIICLFIVISLLLLLIYLIWREKLFCDRHRRIILSCILLLVLSEISFLGLLTQRVSVSFIGHFLELLSCLCCYRILIEETLKKPLKALFCAQEEAVAALREQRHDMLNEIAVISSYVQMDRRSEAIRCLDYMAADLSDQYNFETLPSKAWDKVLETKQAEAENLGIHFTYAMDTELPDNINQLRHIPRIMASLIDAALVRTLSHDEPQVHIQWSENDEKWELSVSNNGPEIPVEIAEKLFDPAITDHDWSFHISTRLTKLLGGELQLASTAELTTVSLVISKSRTGNF